MRVIVSMSMLVAMAVVVVVAMIMAMVMGVARVSARVLTRVVAYGQERLLIVVGLEQLLHGDLPFDGIGAREDVLDHLVLEDWSTQLEQCRGVFLIVLIDMLLLTGIAPRLLDKRSAQLVLGHLDLSLIADLPDQKAKAHPPLGNLAVLGPQRRLILALIGQAPVRPLEPLLQLPPDGIELGRHQRLGESEIVRCVERIEDLAL